MNSIRLSLEIVTPIFMGGESPRKEPELRAPSFRGALRYWTRALAGGLIGDNHIADLKKMETALFGNTETASPIQVRVVQKNLDIISAPILIHKPNSAKRPAYKSGQTIDLVISALRPISDEVWNATMAITNLMITLGGVGLRSRRGYGTLRNSSDTKLSPLPLTEWETNIQGTIINAVNSFNTLARWLNIPTQPLPTGPCAYPCTNKSGILRIGTNHFPTAEDALHDFMVHVPKEDWLGGIHPRQASPLWIHPIQADDGFHLVYIVLASRYIHMDYIKLKAFLNGKPGKYLSIAGWNL